MTSDYIPHQALVPRCWGVRGGWRVSRRPRRIEHMDRLPLCGGALCERELQRVHRAPRGEAQQLAYLWGEGAVVSTCMRGGWRAEVSRAAYPQRACNQWSSVAIRGHQRSSVVIRRLVHGAPDEGGNQWSSVVIRGHQTPCPWRTRSEGGNQWSSVVISGHQWSSDALSMAHMIGGRRSFRPSARASASALPSWAS